MELRENPSYVEEVLRRYNFTKVKRTSNGFSAICPFHEDKNPSFSISATGLWMCWTCKNRGNLKQLHERMGGGEMGWKETIRMMGLQLDNGKFEVVQGCSRAKKELPSDFKRYISREEVPDYVARRLEWPTIKHFELGFCRIHPNKDRVVIPIRFNGNIIGYHGRAVKPGMEPRYYNPENFKIKEHVFNYDECSKSEEVIIVEGAFNSMSMWEKGFRRTMAFFGTEFTPKQLERLFALSPSSVVICFDRDSRPERPGQRAAKKLGKMICQVIPTFIMPLPMDRDPNDLPKSTLEECYGKKVAYESLFRE